MANSNSATASRYLSVSNGHIDGLISYVLDVKPYHTKLSEVVEEFLFEDSISVKLAEDNRSMVVLGPDYINKSGSVTRKVWELLGVSRPLDWLSAQRTTISDGTRRTYPVPTTVINKLSSFASNEKFIAGTHDDYQIPGIQRGVFSQKRWSGPGIARVIAGDTVMCESVDYNLSYGAHSFKTFVANGRVSWKEASIANNMDFANNPASLAYNDVFKSYGTIQNIVSTTYEEWTLTWNGTKLNVVGSTSGKIGEATFKVPFTSTKLNFTFASAVGDSNESAAIINLGDSFVLTPRNKITIAPTAPSETWTLIKTNPQALVSRPTWTRVVTSSAKSAAISVFTRDADFIPETLWTITFTNSTTYTLSVSGISGSVAPTGYPKTVNITTSGLSYKDENVHFSLVPPGDGWQAGDRFTFRFKPKKANYLVFGSVSGWQTPAIIGEWYWNGKIGFKIPQLDYFAYKRSTVISTSNNGLDWTPVVVNRQEMTTINYVDNTFIAAGLASIVGKSINGQNWNDDLTSIVSVDTRLIVIGTEGFIASTEDGETWYQVASNVTANLNGIDVAPTTGATSAATDNLVTIVGDNGTIITSLNGLGWKRRISGVSFSLNSVAHNNDWIIAVGDGGTILRSNDRINWTKINVDFEQNINRIKFINGSFWIVGENGLIATSSNGSTWIRLTSGLTAELDDIAYGNDTFVAVGKSGYTCVSPDGSTWTSFSGNAINSIEYGEEDGIFVCVHKKVNQVVDFTGLRTPRSVASPSIYSIILRDPAQIAVSAVQTSVKGGTVSNNIYGVRPGLVIDRAWADDYCSFKIGSGAGIFNPGEEISVYLAPRGKYSANGDYDELPFEAAYYDTHVGEIEYPIDLLQEYFPLTHSHGSVIFANNMVNGTNIIIDKAMNDGIKLRVTNGIETAAPALATESGWMPIEMRYYDKRASNGTLSPAAFPDMPTIIEAYMGADPDVKVFTIEQPLYQNTQLPSTAILTFDEEFFDKFLPEKTEFTFRFEQADTFGQRLRVKVSENLRIFSRVKLNFDDIILVSVEADNIASFDTATFIKEREFLDLKVSEGGVFSYLGYDELPYDVIGYGMNVETNIVSGLIENPPGSGNFVYTGNPSDFVTLSNGANFPAMRIKEKNIETSSASMSEGLQITMKSPGVSTAQTVTLSYNVNKDTSKGGVRTATASAAYIINHNYAGGTPTVLIYPESGATAFAVIPTNVVAPVGNRPGSLQIAVNKSNIPFKVKLT